MWSVLPLLLLLLLLLSQCVEAGPPGPGGETYCVNMGDILGRVRLQQLNRALMDK
jgi:hypothetical protein